MFYYDDDEKGKKPVMPPMFFLAALGMMYLLNRFIPGFSLLKGNVSYAIGTLMICFGVAMVLWALKTLKKAGTTHIPFEESTALVQSGPFSYSRNPVYLGMVVILFGAFCFMGSSTPLIMVFIFGGIIEDKFIMEEERLLEDKFGDEYKAYKKRVSRWFPLLTEFAWEKTERRKKRDKDQ